jgi:signal transduction histidine kinase
MVRLVPRSPRAWDVLLAVVATVVAQLELLAGDVSSDTRLWHHLAYLLILPALALRREAPLAAISFAAVGLAVEPLLGPATVATPYLCLLFLLVSLGWYASFRTGVLGVLLTLAAGLLYDVTRDDLLVADLVVNVVIIVMAWGAGHVVRRSTDRRVRTEVEADRAAREAALTVRQRIAGDLHDSLAHALTLITLQAGSARERTDPSVAADALATIERTGREALSDMHRFLGLLGGPRDAPGIGDLATLVGRVRDGGLEVHLQAAEGEVPPGVSTTVYRVVQEALTNVLKHSDARSASVVVERDGPVLVARVSDDGSPVDPRTDGSGRGLAGVAQRVRAFDGTVVSGRTSGGWEVEARIPLAGVAT